MTWNEALLIYDEIVELSSHSERKGKKMIYTSSNGYMYSIINKEGEVGFRLSKEDQKLFDQEFGAEPLLSHNAVMKDYVKIPLKLLDQKETAAKWLDKSHKYVNTLAPK